MLSFFVGALLAKTVNVQGGSDGGGGRCVMLVAKVFGGLWRCGVVAVFASKAPTFERIVVWCVVVVVKVFGGLWRCCVVVVFASKAPTVFSKSARLVGGVIVLRCLRRY